MLSYQILCFGALMFHRQSTDKSHTIVAGRHWRIQNAFMYAINFMTISNDELTDKSMQFVYVDSCLSQLCTIYLCLSANDKSSLDF